MWDAAVSGYLVGLSLIVAIGAQNAFVLRQGLRREHVLVVVLICAASDAVLIAAGVGGFGAIARAAPWFGIGMRWLGVAFLVFYGAMRFRAAARGGEALLPQGAEPVPLRRVVVMCLLFTWANPHVYLDTVVLVGSISAQYAPYEAAFGLAAVCASFSFFAALGFGARLLAPIFAKPRAWGVLELAMGCVMWALAAALAFGG